MSDDNIINFPQKDNKSVGDDQKPSARWRADIEYRSENGGNVVSHYFQEIEELHDVIEGGPHFDTLVKCVVTLNAQCGDIPRLTVEQAELI